MNQNPKAIRAAAEALYNVDMGELRWPVPFSEIHVFEQTRYFLRADHALRAAFPSHGEHTLCIPMEQDVVTRLREFPTGPVTVEVRETGPATGALIFRSHRCLGAETSMKYLSHFEEAEAITERVVGALPNGEDD